MAYVAKNEVTGVTQEWTEEQVRAEIIDSYQHDMGTVLGEGMSDAEIDEGVRRTNLIDFFEQGVFEGMNYTITISQLL